MLPCPKCGFDNELGRIFCHQCGTKLDLDAIKPVSRGGKKIYRKSKFTPARVVRRVVDLVILAVLIWGIYLMAQVPEVSTAAPPSDVALTVERKRAELDALVYQQKASALQFSEAELNAFLASFSFDKPEGKGIAVVPIKLQITLGEG